MRYFTRDGVLYALDEFGKEHRVPTDPNGAYDYDAVTFEGMVENYQYRPINPLFITLFGAHEEEDVIPPLRMVPQDGECVGTDETLAIIADIYGCELDMVDDIVEVQYNLNRETV